MKIKNLSAILIALILLINTFIIPTSAKEPPENILNVEIIINDEVSAKPKEKIERYFATGEPPTNDGTSVYGLTCTLLGHKLENTSVSTITHKVRATAPRCKEETYIYQACTRCDYENATLVKTEYIYCCA